MCLFWFQKRRGEDSNISDKLYGNRLEQVQGEHNFYFTDDEREALGD